MGDPYIDPRTGVLRNRLGIADEDELRAAETDISTAALFALEMSSHLGEGHFDFAHLRALHVHVFGELYAWAGKPRTVDIAKGAWFCLARNIDEFAASVFRELADENYLVGLDRDDLVRRVAALYGQLNALHPFREGNGRTQRAFLTQLGRLGAWRVRWGDLDQATNDEASRRSLAGDDSALVEMLDALLEEVPQPAMLSGVRRRVVLAIPAVAREILVGMEQLRAGPYPKSAPCDVCERRIVPDEEPAVVLLRPLPPPEPSHILSFAHAGCGRSRVLPPMSPREVRAWRAAEAQQGADATGAAFLVTTTPARAAFAWLRVGAVLEQAGDDVRDLVLSQAMAAGLRPDSGIAPPEELVPGWSVTVRPATSSVVVTDSAGVIAFTGDHLDLPAAWLDAITLSKECVLYMVSRGSLDLDGLNLAAQQGRLVSGVAAAVVDPP